MACVLKKLASDYTHSNECEKVLSEILYSYGILPNPVRYSRGCEPKWDVQYGDLQKTKAEIKIQSGKDLCMELNKRTTGVKCGIYTTEATIYIMINKTNFNDQIVGMVRIVFVEDILNYIQNKGNYLRIIPSFNEMVTFIDVADIRHINFGYVDSLIDSQGKCIKYFFESFKKFE